MTHPKEQTTSPEIDTHLSIKIRKTQQDTGNRRNSKEKDEQSLR